MPREFGYFPQVFPLVACRRLGVKNRPQLWPFQPQYLILPRGRQKWRDLSGVVSRQWLPICQLIVEIEIEIEIGIGIGIGIEIIEIIEIIEGIEGIDSCSAWHLAF
jgi:hypothetical protein